MPWNTHDQWNTVIDERIRLVVADILGNPLTGRDALAFVKWKVTAHRADLASVSTSSNVFRYPVGAPQLSVRLGSIHSVKGETHWATLVLDTYFVTPKHPAASATLRTVPAVRVAR